MTIVHYEPWRLISRFHRWLPVVDVYEEAERFVVRADLSGVDPKDVEITAEKGRFNDTRSAPCGKAG
jgi:HSP20 family protein